VDDRNIRGGTTLHEFTHALSGTRDYSYGCQNDQSLARYSGEYAFNNADSYNVSASTTPVHLGIDHYPVLRHSGVCLDTVLRDHWHICASVIDTVVCMCDYCLENLEMYMYFNTLFSQRLRWGALNLALGQCWLSESWVQTRHYSRRLVIR
jgi:hypothetical protein